MRTPLAVTTLFALFLLCGCKKGPSIVGRWDSMLIGFPAKVELRDGGQVSGHIVANGLGTVDVVGTYELNDKNLVIKGDRATVKAEPSMQALIQGQEKAITEQVTKVRSGTIEWKNENQFVFTETESKQSATFTRETQAQ